MTFLPEHFETPALLLHLILVAVLAGLWIVSVRARRRRLANWPRVLRLSDHQRRGWPIRLVIGVVGLACLVVAMAGPFGGESQTTKEVPGRDLMIVLDVSRSMAAEQPSRLDKAIRSLRTLAADKQFPAGTRIGLVVFAARPWLEFPLTRDVDHLADTLNQLAAGDFPLDVRGDPEFFVSGTRLGAALKFAVESFPTPRPGRQDIVLLSDGDDPTEDEEWLQGVTVARTSGVPVHVVAIGERGAKATIPYRGDMIRFEGEAVTTTVQSERLKEVAELTGGLLLTLERGELPLAGLIAKRWSEVRPPAEANILRTPADTRPVRRFPWLCAALLAFVIVHSGVALPGWLWRASDNPSRKLEHSEGPDPLTPIPLPRNSGGEGRMRRLVVGLACFAFVSAEFESAGMADLRRGQEAFARLDFADAIIWFDKAQPFLADPGLVAFNRAAAHYRLEQFGDAARAYRQALDDGAITDRRRDRAWYDLGNSLLNLGGIKDRTMVEEAIAAYKKCLAGSPDAALKRDAEFNLAIAGQRLLKIQPPQDPPGSEPNPMPGDVKDPDDPNSPNLNKAPMGPTKNPQDPNGGPDPTSAGGVDAMKKSSASGKSNVLPDDPKIDFLTPDQVAAALASHSERITQERRRDRQTRDVLSPQGKDW